MPDRPTPAQIRGARGMLDWSMADLATAARVSISTVKRLESGVPRLVSDEAHGLVQEALETGGICFLPDGGHGPGMRLARRGPERPADGRDAGAAGPD